MKSPSDTAPRRPPLPVLPAERPSVDPARRLHRLMASFASPSPNVAAGETARTDGNPAGQGTANPTPPIDYRSARRTASCQAATACRHLVGVHPRLVAGPRRISAATSSVPTMSRPRSRPAPPRRARSRPRPRRPRRRSRRGRPGAASGSRSRLRRRRRAAPALGAGRASSTSATWCAIASSAARTRCARRRPAGQPRDEAACVRPPLRRPEPGERGHEVDAARGVHARCRSARCRRPTRSRRARRGATAALRRRRGQNPRLHTAPRRPARPPRRW